MTHTRRDPSTVATARLAGVWYLILAICGGFAEFGVRQRLLVPGDAAATAENLLSSARLFRLGIGAELIGQVVFVLLAFALYDLLKVVHRRRATTMVVLALIAVTITCVNLVAQAAALQVLEGGAWSSVFDAGQRAGLSMFFLDLHRVGYGVVAQVFFGAWLLPLAGLIWASGFVPRLVGGLVGLAGVGYLADVATALLVPRAGVVVSEFTFVGELVLMLWLLVRGVNAVRPPNGSTDEGRVRTPAASAPPLVPPATTR